MAAVTRLGLYGGPRLPYPPQVATITATLSGTIFGATEQDIRDGGKTLIITMANDTWVASPDYQEIMDRITAPTFPTTGWNNEVRDKALTSEWVRTSDTVLTWTLGAQAGYDISADETGIEATIPHTELTITGDDLEPVATPTIDILAVIPAPEVLPGAGGGYKKHGKRKGKDRRYPRRIMVDGQVYLVRSVQEERSLLRMLAERAEEKAQQAAESPSVAPVVAKKARRLVRRIEKRVETLDSDERLRKWREMLEQEDEQIISLYTRRLH